MFLVNSRFPLVSAAPIPSHQRVVFKVGAPLLPKLRGHFAEFLNHNSLDRLSILYLITCVGLGYGRLKPRADAFLGSIGSPNPPFTGVPSDLRHHERRICLPFALHPWTGTTIARLGYLPASHLLIRLPPRIRSRAPPKPAHHKGDRAGFGRLVSPVQHGRFFAGTGISTRCPSTTPVGLALGPDLPRAD